jgi:hypothetical protein
MHTDSPNKQKKFKQMSTGNCFMEEESIADGGIRSTNDHNNVTSVLQST